MAADSELRTGFSELDRVVEGRPIGHQRRAGQNPAPMGTDNALIDSARQAEIVSV